jgi:hypothetical protein
MEHVVKIYWENNVSSHILNVDIFESVEENRSKFKQNEKQNLNIEANRADIFCESFYNL